MHQFSLGGALQLRGVVADSSPGLVQKKSGIVMNLIECQSSKCYRGLPISASLDASYEETHLRDVALIRGAGLGWSA